MHKVTGVILVNLGTPCDLNLKAVRSFLAEFLMDPYVLQIPWLARAILVYGIILPFRGPATQAAYAAIWDKKTGSPLLYHSQNLSHHLAVYLNEHYPNQYRVQLAMRYGKGSLSIPKVVDNLKKKGIEKITLLPLYPQYAASTNESSIQYFLKQSTKHNLKDITVIKDFYNNIHFIKALSTIIEEKLASYAVKPYLLFSFHGLPQDHVKKTGCQNCPANHACPDINGDNRWCYRAQCFATVKALSLALKLIPESYGVSFQSRLGKLPWIGPYTEEIIKDLAQKNIQHLAVVSPSFITDCLETQEEIDIRLRESWLNLVPSHLGGQFSFIPCLNDHPQWVDGLAQIIHNT